MRSILVPLDFSETSAYALEVAAFIAREKSAEIVAFHMLGLSEAVLAKDEAQEYEEARYYMDLARKRFKTFLDRPYLKGLKIREIVQNYKVFKEINNITAEQNIDLVVMGSHGTSGLNALFAGSNTEKVVRTSGVPVLVIKAPKPDFKIKKILLACDFTDETILTYKKARAFAMAFSAKFLPIYINTPYGNFKSNAEIEAHISQFLFKSGEIDPGVIIYNDFSVEQGLINYCQNHDIDILAIPTHGRKGLSHFFMGSIGEDLANRANIPVLTFRL